MNSASSLVIKSINTKKRKRFLLSAMIKLTTSKLKIARHFLAQKDTLEATLMMTLKALKLETVLNRLSFLLKNI